MTGFKVSPNQAFVKPFSAPLRTFFEADMNRILAPLRTEGQSIMLSSPTMDTRSDQARMRIREEMERKKLTQRELADLLDWSQSRVSKILTGRVGLLVDDMETLCFGVGISVVEAIRDRGLEFCAEMAPNELRLLERIRQLPRPVLDAIFTIIGIKLTHPQDVPHARNLARKVARR